MDARKMDLRDSMNLELDVLEICIEGAVNNLRDEEKYNQANGLKSQFHRVKEIYELIEGGLVETDS